MKVPIFPILITSLSIIAGYTFYTLYQSSTPHIHPTLRKNHKPEMTEYATAESIEETVLVTGAMPTSVEVKRHAIEVMRQESREPSVDDTLENMQPKDREETASIYVEALPKNYDELQAQANEAFTHVAQYADEMQIQIIEEEESRAEIEE